MFRKILIANRGEIACRIIRTAKSMGICTVAVFSEQDSKALHVSMADEAICIGPAPANESYLLTGQILAAAKETGADAVHPGYGFLSENSTFASAVEKAGLTFIGPSEDAIATMGDKIRSKKLANKAGVSTVPGYLGIAEDDEEALKIGKEIGFPLMVKASAGGGGKGMRIAFNPAELLESFQLAGNEARTSFGDDRIFLEKYIERPRHIEIQILGDKHGNIIHLGERECSIQRRHQKIIEEAPSAFIDSDTRDLMGAQAIALAKAVKYYSAGTVEFIVDEDKNFYFLEMNTRLQVEHPVTEYVTGIDLVEQMIRIAAGEKLSLAQSDVRWNGWAIEARIYAEDPTRNFLPSIGRLTRYQEPKKQESVRIDSGVIEGGEVSVYYDPLISKLIAAGRSRQEALKRLKEALSMYLISGLSHNISFLSAVIENKRFGDANFSTDFLSEEFPDGFIFKKPEGPLFNIFAASASFLKAKMENRSCNFGSRTYIVQSFDRDGSEVSVKVEMAHDNKSGIISLDGHAVELKSNWRPGLTVFQVLIDNINHNFFVHKNNLGWTLTSGTYQAELVILTANQSCLFKFMPINEAPDLTRYLLSPMPGLLVRLSVKVGDIVKEGDELAVVEAMKMENILRSTRDGVISEIHFSSGDSLEADEVILEFKEQ